MFRPVAVVLACLFLAASANAVRELVIIEEPQPAQRVEGVVLDIQDEPIPGMTVTDRTEDGSAILRSTKTDAKGHFHFSTQRGKTIYTLRFDHPLWNPLQLKLKLDRHAARHGITARPHIGG
ncbi:MAG TPA: carboxypeptidase-like regulatory domain-containing protein [Terriglobales bacterium]|nr:carboxypeptidase-like regulatory domain-containing protein [Terriglobales bacterium]